MNHFRGRRRLRVGRGFRGRLGGLKSNICALIRQMSTCFIRHVKLLTSEILIGGAEKSRPLNEHRFQLLTL